MLKRQKHAIEKYTGCEGHNKVILNLNPAVPQVDMQTTVFIEASIPNFQELLKDEIEESNRRN